MRVAPGRPAACEHEKKPNWNDVITVHCPLAAGQPVRLATCRPCGEARCGRLGEKVSTVARSRNDWRRKVSVMSQLVVPMPWDDQGGCLTTHHSTTRLRAATAISFSTDVFEVLKNGRHVISNPIFRTVWSLTLGGSAICRYPRGKTPSIGRRRCLTQPTWTGCQCLGAGCQCLGTSFLWRTKCRAGQLCRPAEISPSHSRFKCRVLDVTNSDQKLVLGGG